MPSTAFWQERLTKCEALVVIYEDAIEAVLTSGIESYTLDTGQSRQTVTQQDLKKLENALDGLLNRCATLQARISGAGTAIVRPCW